MSGHQAYRYVRYDRPLAEKRAERASGGLPGCGPTSQTSVTLRVDTVYCSYVKSASSFLCKFRSGAKRLVRGAAWPMRPTPARVEVARALIARVKAADSSINRRDELWYASDSDALDRDWHVRRFAPADSLRMGDGPVTE